MKAKMKMQWVRRNKVFLADWRWPREKATTTTNLHLPLARQLLLAWITFSTFFSSSTIKWAFQRHNNKLVTVALDLLWGKKKEDDFMIFSSPLLISISFSVLLFLLLFFPAFAFTPFYFSRCLRQPRVAEKDISTPSLPTHTHHPQHHP